MTTIAPIAVGAYGRVDLRTAFNNVRTHDSQRRAYSATPLETSKVAVSKALDTAEFVLTQLDKLESEIFHANMDGKVADSSAARFSRQGTVAVMLRQIDQAVSQAEYKDINLVSSNGREVRLQTSGDGGSMLVSPRPMDTRGLGLETVAITAVDVRGLGIADLGIIAQTDVEKALELVANAKKVARSRMDDLAGIAAIFDGEESFLDKINSIAAIESGGANRGKTSRGTLNIGPGLFFDLMA